MNELGKAFVEDARKWLCSEYPVKLRQCIEKLSEEDIWWREHETDNSIGNLILHLSGNVRQWIVSGIGGAQNRRDREKEFSERKMIPKARLLSDLEQVLKEADSTLRAFDPEKLLEVRHFQVDETTCLDAIFHVVEHFSGHLGQIIYITKLRTGTGLKFYNL